MSNMTIIYNGISVPNRGGNLRTTCPLKVTNFWSVGCCAPGTGCCGGRGGGQGPMLSRTSYRCAWLSSTLERPRAELRRLLQKLRLSPSSRAWLTSATADSISTATKSSSWASVPCNTGGQVPAFSPSQVRPKEAPRRCF